MKTIDNELQTLAKLYSEGRVSRRQFMGNALKMGFSVAAASTFLASCAPSAAAPSAPGAAPAAGTAASDTGITLTMIGEALPPLESLNQKKADFEAETGIKVVIEPYAIDQVVQKTTADFAGKTGIYDMYLNPHVQLATHVENGWVMPLAEFQADNSLKDPIADIDVDIKNKDWLNGCFAYKGKLYGVPFSVHTIYYNWRWDVFEHSEEQAAFADKYGYKLPSPPLTMQHMRDTSEFFTRKAGEKLMGETLANNVYGNTLAAKRHISTLWNFFNVLYAFNGIVIDSPSGDEYGPIVINSPEGVAALEYYKDIALNFCPPGTGTYTWDEQLAALQTGLSVSSLLWADASFAISEDKTQSQVVGKLAFSGVPVATRKTTNLHGWGMYIPVSSKYPKEAWKFLQWTQRPDVQAALMSTGAISLHDSPYHQESVYNLTYAPSHYFITNGEVLNVNGEPAYRKPGAGWGVPQEYVELKDPQTGETHPVAFKLDRFPEHNEMDNILMKYISECLTSDLDPKTALDRAVEEIKVAIPKLA